MSIDDARALRDPSSQAEALAVERAEIEHFYGIADEATVLRDKHGRRRREAKLWAHVTAAADGREDALLARDGRDAERGSIAHVRHRWLTARAVLRILGLFGIRAVTALPYGSGSASAVTAEPIILDPARWQAAARWAMANARWLVELGFTVRRDVDKNPVQFLGAVLRKMGIRLHGRQARHEDGSRDRTYTVDVASVQAVEADCRRFRDRLLARPPDAIDMGFTPEMEAALDRLLNGDDATEELAAAA
jgi:hypothetical protein